MDKDFKSFKEKYDYLVLNNPDINTCMFAFGVQIESPHHEDRVGLYNPIKDLLKVEWDYDVLRKIQQALGDHQVETDEDQNDLPFGEKGIKKAIKFNRPLWTFFYLIGNLKGAHNSMRMKSDEVLKNLLLFPSSFLRTYNERLVFLCNYFDEKDERLHIKVKDGKMNAWFEKKIED